MKDLQNEKRDIIQTVNAIQAEIGSLKFPKMSVSFNKKFNNQWKDRFSKILSALDNYKNNEFPVVVIGRLNAGKSTLLNALLGIEILPSANRDTTSLLTKIHYGSVNTANVYFDNGNFQQINFEQKEIEKYVNYRGEHFSNKIKRIDITLNNDILKNGICFLDSPGLDSINELNKVISYELLMQANSVILVFSGNDGGGQENYELIKNIFNLNFDDNYNIVFVITKSDLLDENEYKQAYDCLLELINKARKDLGKPNNVTYNICGVSSYLALKYQQIKSGIISESDAVKDKRLQLNSINDLEKVYDESNFVKLHELLQTSVIESNNNKKRTQNLLVLINNFLSSLLEDYLFIEKSINESTDLQKRQHKCKEQEKLINSISERGNKVIEKYESQLKTMKEIDNRSKIANEILNTIFDKIVEYMNTTPYETLSNKKFKNLNDNVKRIAEEQAIIAIEVLERQLRKILMDTIDELEKIEDDYNSKISELFNQPIEEKKDITFYGVKVKSHFLASGVVTTIASGTIGGVGGFFAIGNAILPVVGGMIGAIVGMLLGIMSYLGNNSEQKKREIIRQKIHSRLMEKDYVLTIAIKDAINKYLSLAPLLEECLSKVLKDKTAYYNEITKNYEELKNTQTLLKENLQADIASIKNLFPVIGTTMSKYMDV